MNSLKFSPNLSLEWGKEFRKLLCVLFTKRRFFIFILFFYQNKWWYTVLSWLVMSPTNVTEPSLRKRTFEIFRNLLVKNVSIPTSSRAEVLIIWNVWKMTSRMRMVARDKKDKTKCEIRLKSGRSKKGLAICKGIMQVWQRSFLKSVGISNLFVMKDLLLQLLKVIVF